MADTGKIRLTAYHGQGINSARRFGGLALTAEFKRGDVTGLMAEVRRLVESPEIGVIRIERVETGNKKPGDR